MNLQPHTTTGESAARHEPPRDVGLLLLLSATAGATDAIGFLGLHGLFTAHITGNIVVLTSHLVAGGEAGVGQLLAVPMFMAVAALARLLGLVLDRRRRSAHAFLALQFVFLLAFLLLSLPLGETFGMNAPWAVAAGMCGVAAMAVQTVLVQTSLPGVASTSVLTTNVGRFTIAAVEATAGPMEQRAEARSKVASTFPQIFGFIVGCAAGGVLEWQVGLSALLLPILLSLAALIWFVRDTLTSGMSFFARGKA
jgi:uncharacterized membrane protein YoaK (UPF0700 family)